MCFNEDRGDAGPLVCCQHFVWGSQIYFMHLAVIMKASGKSKKDLFTLEYETLFNLSSNGAFGMDNNNSICRDIKVNRLALDMHWFYPNKDPN